MCGSSTINHCVKCLQDLWKIWFTYI